MKTNVKRVLNCSFIVIAALSLVMPLIACKNAKTSNGGSPTPEKDFVFNLNHLAITISPDDGVSLYAGATLCGAEKFTEDIGSFTLSNTVNDPECGDLDSTRC